LKFPVVAALLAEGFDVVMSDIDAIWCRAPSFPARIDMAFQRIVYHPASVVKEWGFAVCAGFVFFRATDPMKRLLQECVKQQLKVACDQVALNLALLQSQPYWNFPEAYARSFAEDSVSSVDRFAAFAEIEFSAVLEQGQSRIVALRHDRFWRHAFVPPRDLVICHPNSEKEETAKIQALERYMIAQ
jgi:hypothetical protein